MRRLIRFTAAKLIIALCNLFNFQALVYIGDRSGGYSNTVRIVGEDGEAHFKQALQVWHETIPPEFTLQKMLEILKSQGKAQNMDVGNMNAQTGRQQ